MDDKTFGVFYVELCLGLCQAAHVLGVDEEDYAGGVGEVVLPEATGLDVPAQIVRGESDISHTQFLRGYDNKLSK